MACLKCAMAPVIIINPGRFCNCDVCVKSPTVKLLILLRLGSLCCYLFITFLILFSLQEHRNGTYVKKCGPTLRARIWPTIQDPFSTESQTSRYVYVLSDLSVLLGQLSNLTLTTGNVMGINRDRNNKAVAGEHL